MKRINTIKSHQEFDAIIRHGAKLRSPHFSLYYLPSDLGYTRIGLAVGKANGGAVERVRVKRQVRAMLATRNDYSSPISLIIVIRPTFAEAEFHQNEQELNALLDQIKENQH